MDFFFFLGVFCGLLLIAVYIIQIFREPINCKMPDLADGVVLFISGAAIAASIKVCYIAFDPAIPIGDERTYIVLGGVAVIWVSIQMLVKIIKIPFIKQNKKEENENSS
jgi:hypothetical protein